MTKHQYEDFPSRQNKSVTFPVSSTHEQEYQYRYWYWAPHYLICHHKHLNNYFIAYISQKEKLSSTTEDCQYSLQPSALPFNSFLSHHKVSSWSYLDWASGERQMISYRYLPDVAVTAMFTEAEMSLLSADRSKFSVGMRAPFYQRFGENKWVTNNIHQQPGGRFSSTFWTHFL